tara:strand:- start:1424 stop:1930 length:507 start_codon:yes stop_codon:yes gene_type:complete
MSLQKIPRELLLKIWEYLENNTESINLLLTSKDFYKIGNKNGFIKSINFNNNTNPIDYIENYHKHINSINSINISTNIIPHNWIFRKWPKVVILNNCNFSKIIKPIEITNTESLSIIDFRHNIKRKIIVDWRMFPNLKFLKIYGYKFDNIGITKYCTKLIQIDLDLVV